MTLSRLLLRNLFYHWRGNAAVLLGVAVGTAVLTGALLVGDSLRGSLRDLTLEQLGWVDQSLVSGRFIRADIVRKLKAERIAPAILLQGAASASRNASGKGAQSSAIHRVSHVAILGVDEQFWSPEQSQGKQSNQSKKDENSFWQSAKEEVVLNQTLAKELGVDQGDTVTLYLQKASLLPRESVFGRREAGEVADELRLTVRTILPNQGMARFSLNPSPSLPRNAFVPLGLLQARLNQSGRVNALLAGGGTPIDPTELRMALTLEDWGLKLYTPESRVIELFAKLDRNRDDKLTRAEWRGRISESMAKAADRNRDGTLTREELDWYFSKYRNYFSLESRQMLLEPFVVTAAKQALQSEFIVAPTLVYLANSISDGKQSIPYSIVAAVNPDLAPPLGPFLHNGVNILHNDEIVLVDWSASPLKVKVGDPITLTYFLLEIEGRIREQNTTFRLHGFLPLQGVADDPDFTPEFPGITDKLDIRDWNPPFPYDNKRVQPRDEKYWEEYRTTPKAYVTLKKGQELWGSRFGDVTSLRFVYRPGPMNFSYEGTYKQRIVRDLLGGLDPAEGGLLFENVRERNLEKSSGAADFGELFLGFSFFLIVAALLLVGLLIRLNLDRRATEAGILLAAGYRRGTLRWLWLAEGSLLAAVGGLLGLAAAVLYAGLMLGYLRHTTWPGGLDQAFLKLHAGENFGLSYLIGYFASLIVSILTIAWAVRFLARVAPRALLSGETTQAATSGSEPRPPRWCLVSSVFAIVGGLALVILGNFVHDAEMQAMTFFGSGALFLTAGLTALRAWMHGTRHAQVIGHGALALARLGVRNAGRHAVRSLLTAGLLASATFLIIAVQSFYRDPGRDFLELHAGSGGFALIGETDVPIFQDLNSHAGRDDLNLSEEAAKTLQDVAFYPLRLRAGDDASCLNLYQPRQPRLLGVPAKFIERDGFQFKATIGSGAKKQENPWKLLQETQDDAIPVFGEANTVEWMLHKGIGQTLEIKDERGANRTLRIVGLLQDSVFQSELLMSEANFLKLFPRQEGYSYFLIQAPPEHAGQVRTLLETALADHGFTVVPSAERLEAFLAVENTYLSTFQALGGLGLLLGALGLAVVLMRSVWERRGELALLRALGFRNGALGWLLLTENSFLLILGLGIGTISAAIAVAPNLLSSKGELPWIQVIGLLVGVMLVGLTAGAAALAATLRAPLLAALRRE